MSLTFTDSPLYYKDAQGNYQRILSGADMTGYRTATAQDVIDAGKEAAGLGLTGASVGDLVRVNAVDASGKPTSWKKVALNEIKCNHNYIDNWDFTNPVNQRGQQSYSTTGYCIDRWWRVFGVTTIGDGGISIAGNTSESYGPAFRQALSDPQKFAGKTVTISILVDEITGGYLSLGCTKSSGLNSGMAGATVSKQIRSPGILTVTGTIPNDVGSNTYPLLMVTIGVEKSATVKIRAVKFELGSEQTLAHQENGQWVLNEIPDYKTELIKCKTSTADTSDIYANKTIGYNVSNPNLLDNWYFAGGGSQLGDGVFPINQRGQTVYSGGGYGVDRWLNSNSSITTTVESDGLLVTSPISGSTWKIVQKFESSFREQLKGKTVTFSILFKELSINNSISACIYDQIGNHLGTASYSESGLVTVTYTVPFSITDFRTIVYGGVVSEFSAKIIAVKLELGSEQTLCHNEGTEESPIWVLNELPDYEEELRKCQRYFIRLGMSAWARYGLGIAGSTTTASAIINLPIMMGRNIRCTYSGDIRLNGIAISNISEYPQWSPNNITLDITATDLVERAVYALRNYNDATAHIDLYVE